MSPIITMIRDCTAALAAVTPEHLTADQLHGSVDRISAYDPNSLIDDYWHLLPEKPENEHDRPAWEKDLHQRALEINHQLNLFNQELSRIKTMHNALKVPQLLPLIHAAQDIIRPLYNFTSSLNEGK